MSKSRKNTSNAENSVTNNNYEIITDSSNSTPSAALWNDKLEVGETSDFLNKALDELWEQFDESNVPQQGNVFIDVESQQLGLMPYLYEDFYNDDQKNSFLDGTVDNSISENLVEDGSSSANDNNTSSNSVRTSTRARKVTNNHANKIPKIDSTDKISSTLNSTEHMTRKTNQRGSKVLAPKSSADAGTDVGSSSNIVSKSSTSKPLGKRKLAYDNNEFTTGSVISDSPRFSATALEKMFRFPSQITKAMNAANQQQLEAVVDDYFAVNCKLSTKAFPTILEGINVIKGFYMSILNSHPDMINRLTDVRLNPDQSIMFRGTFTGTFVDKYSKAPSDHERHVGESLLHAKNSWTFVELLTEPSSEQDSGRNKLPKEEIERLQKLESDAKNNRIHVTSVSNWICKIQFQGQETKDNSTELFISQMCFDWKTLDLQDSGI